jgi:Rha family phage regulatory protein
MNNLVSPDVQLIDGKLTINSLNIADVFKKRHGNVLRKIEIEATKGRSNGFNFTAVEYIDQTNVKRTMYLIDERFAIKIIISFIGISSNKYVLAYIYEFIRMRENLNNMKLLELEEENKQLKEKAVSLEN